MKLEPHGIYVQFDEKLEEKLFGIIIITFYLLKVGMICYCHLLPYSRLFLTVKYFVHKIFNWIKFSTRMRHSKIKSYLKFVTP